MGFIIELKFFFGVSFVDGFDIVFGESDVVNVEIIFKLCFFWRSGNWNSFSNLVSYCII